MSRVFFSGGLEWPSCVKEYPSLFQSQKSASYQTLRMWVAGPHRRTPRLGPFVSSSEDSLHQPERASYSSVRPEGLRTLLVDLSVALFCDNTTTVTCVRLLPRSSRVRPMSQRTLSGAPYGDRVGLDPSPGGSRSTGPQMASGDPSFCDLPDHEASSVLLPASDSRIAGTDDLLQPWDDLQVYAFPPIAVIRKVLVN